MLIYMRLKINIMKHLSKFHFTLLILIIFFTACQNSGSYIGTIKPSDKIVTVELLKYDIEGLTAASAGIKLIYIQNNKSKISVTGPQNMVEALKIIKEKNKNIYFKIKNDLEFDLNDTSNYVKIMIFSPQIKNIIAMNNGKVEINDIIVIDDSINIKSFSKGKIYIKKLVAKNINIESYTESSVFIDTIIAKNIATQSFTESQIRLNKKENL